MMRVTPAAVVAALIVATTGACSSSETDQPAPSATKASPSASRSAISDDDLTAKIAAGASPKDVVWKQQPVPSGWRQLKTEQGTAQWRIGDTACVVGLSQPAGLGSDKSPDDAGIVDRQVQQIAKAIGREDDLDFSEDSVMVPAEVAGSSAQVRQRFAQRTFSSGPDAQGVVRAHRFGDFALIAYGACGKGDFDEQYAGSIKGFVDSLVVTLTF